MALLRSCLFGGIVAIGFPMLVKNVGGDFGDMVSRTSMHFEIADVWIRVNWPLFFIVTVLTFGFLQLWRK